MPVLKSWRIGNKIAVAFACDIIKKPLKNPLYFYIKKWYNRSSLNQLNMHKTYV